MWPPHWPRSEPRGMLSSQTWQHARPLCPSSHMGRGRQTASLLHWLHCIRLDMENAKHACYARTMLGSWSMKQRGSQVKNNMNSGIKPGWLKPPWEMNSKVYKADGREEQLSSSNPPEQVKPSWPSHYNHIIPRPFYRLSCTELNHMELGTQAKSKESEPPATSA